MFPSDLEEILRQFYPDGIIYQDFLELARDVSRRTYRPLSRDNQKIELQSQCLVLYER